MFHSMQNNSSHETPGEMEAASAQDRATGGARYTADLVSEGAVVAGMARSPHPHARVVRVDATETLRIPGVLAVLTPDDFQGVAIGHHHADEPVLSPVARYVGDGVAAVAALDNASMIRGIEALKVDYQLLPHACTVDDALSIDTALHASCPDNVAHRFSAERGDWDAASSRVSMWAEGTFQTEAVAHAYLEPRASLVRAAGDHLELVTGTHFPTVLVEQYRHIVERWGAKLEIITPDIGGSFGAKWEHPTHLVCLAFAHRLGRDVAMVMHRRDDMIAGRTRLAMRLRVRLGATADGELVAKETTLFADNGAYSAHGPSVMMAAAIRMDNLYRFSAVKASGELVYTNNMPSECFRGFGSPQSAFAQEQLIDELARRLGRDPVELRRLNAVQAGDTTMHGWQIGSCGFDDCLDVVRTRIDEHRQHASPSVDERYRIGYGVAAGAHGISNRGYDRRFDRALVALSVVPDGTIRIGSGEVELGCGTVDMLVTTVARELDIERNRLRVVLGDTESVPYGLGSFASRTTFFAGRAAMDACEQFAVACGRLGRELGLGANASISDVVDHAVRQDRGDELAVTGSYEPTGVSVPDDSGYANISPAYTFAAHGCCVRIDVLTGKVSVEQYWAAHDAGAILSRNGAEGQVIGGVSQGLGFALTEAVSVNDQGHLLNPGYLDNRVATFPDAVPVDVVFVGTYEEAGPAGAKTIAEPPIIPVAACVANAIHDALGVRLRQLPMTSERVWRALRTVDTT